MTPKLLQVTPRLPVRDLRKTLDFYIGRLGFEIDTLWPHPQPAFAILHRDSTHLGFLESTEHQGGPIGYLELYIEVTDSVTLHESIKGKVPIEWGPEVYSYGRREFALRDPDGYLVIFTEPTDEPPSTSEPGDGSAG